MQLAVTIQHMLGVEDGDTIAHGYTFDRNTVDVFFEDGKCVKHTYCGVHNKEISREEFEYFNGEEILHVNIKRWYTANTSEELVSWCETFGKPLPLI